MPNRDIPAIRKLLERNQAWSEERRRIDPEFFERHAAGQAPPYLYIGCADSRVPPTEITRTGPGDLFVVRNVANLVPRGDAAALSAIEYAISVLRVEHVIVCGHTQCGGVLAALGNDPIEGSLGVWLDPLRRLVEGERAELEGLDDEQRWRRTVELNVRAQLQQLAELDPVRRAWDAGRPLTLHGWLYDLRDGRVHELAERVAPWAEAAE